MLIYTAVMSKRKLLLIILIVLGTPLLGLAISLLTSHYASPITTNSDGTGIGKELIVIGAIIYGVSGLIASLVLGPLVSYLTRHSSNLIVSLLGYLIPSSIAISIIIWGFISVVILKNPTPY